MEKYYFLIPDTKKIGVPVFLEGNIYDRFIPLEEYKQEGGSPLVNDSHPWRMGWLNTDAIPPILYLINRHKKIDFDYFLAPNGGGFFVSVRLFRNAYTCL